MVKEPETGAEEAPAVKEADIGPADPFAGPIQPVEPIIPVIKFPDEPSTPVEQKSKYIPKEKPLMPEIKVIRPNKKPRLEETPIVKEHLKRVSLVPDEIQQNFIVSKEMTEQTQQANVNKQVKSASILEATDSSEDEGPSQLAFNTN